MTTPITPSDGFTFEIAFPNWMDYREAERTASLIETQLGRWDEGDKVVMVRLSSDWSDAQVDQFSNLTRRIVDLGPDGIGRVLFGAGADEPPAPPQVYDVFVTKPDAPETLILRGWNAPDLTQWLNAQRSVPEGTTIRVHTRRP